jgi:sugar-specific transcriptional regulator TrmB
MNEMDLLTKIEGLEKAIKEHQDFVNTYSNTLTTTKQELVDLHKPELTPQQLDAIERAVEQAVSEFDFTDTENFEIDYSLDYDGRVQCESHEFINDTDLVEMIVNKVCSLFKEADCPEDDNSQVNTQTVAEKII